MINQEMMDRWTEAARSAPEAKEALPIPFGILAGEALDALRFSQRFWEPAAVEKLPGLVSAVKGGRFQPNIRTELSELYAVTQQAQTRYVLLAKKSTAAPLERAEFVLGEVKATLLWHFEDGETSDEDTVLAQLAETHGSAQSHDGIAAALFDYAELADRNRDNLDGLGGFDLALIEEARTLGQRLREQSAGPAEPGTESAVREALLLRNRLATILYDRILVVRAAARFVFRGHPEVVKQVSSQYGRKRRASHRGKQEPQAQPVESEVTVANA